MRHLEFALAIAATLTLAACSGSETTTAEPATTVRTGTPATTPEPGSEPEPRVDPTAVAQAPSFDQPNRRAEAPVDADQRRKEAIAAAEAPQETSSFRVPADAIGGERLDTDTYALAMRGQAALYKHFDDLGVAKDSFYFKFPVTERGGYWSMGFYGTPPTRPDGVYVEVRVHPDGSAEVIY